jgi:hypothetical protein
LGARRGVLAQSWINIHSFAPPCAARPKAQRGACGDLEQALMALGMTCEELPAALVEQYLPIKRSGLL